MSKHITREMWHGSFNDIANPGDTVDFGIVDYFANVLPPASMEIGYIQCGEPCSHVFQKETGMCRATYLTFAFDNERNLWEYKGQCFKHCTENVDPVSYASARKETYDSH